MNSFSSILRPCIHFFLLTLLIVSSVSICLGQSLINHSVTSYHPTFTTLSNQGNSLVVQLSLDNTSRAESAVRGFNLSVLFPAFTSPASQVSVSANTSWIGSSAEGSLSYTYDAVFSEVNLSYLRADQNGQSGQGAVAIFTFTREGGFSAFEAQAAVSGGLVMVDNLDFKWNPGSSSAIEVSAYPNPATDYLKVTCTDPSPSTVQLYAINGSLVASSASNDRHQLDVRHLSPGTYMLQVQSKNQTISKKISIQPTF